MIRNMICEDVYIMSKTSNVSKGVTINFGSPQMERQRRLCVL